MRNSVMIFPLMLLTAFPSGATRPAEGVSTRCPKPATALDKASFKRLGDLPAAEAFRAVLRSSDCPASFIQARDRLGPVPKPRR